MRTLLQYIREWLRKTAPLMISQLIRNKKKLSHHDYNNSNNNNKGTQPTTHRFISQWLDKQNTECSYNEIAFSHQKDKVMIHATACLNFENLYMIVDFIHNISFIYNIKKLLTMEYPLSSEWIYISWYSQTIKYLQGNKSQWVVCVVMWMDRKGIEPSGKCQFPMIMYCVISLKMC